MARTVAVLLSRQAVRACGATPWVARCSDAVAWIGERGDILCTSIGMPTWELLVALAVRRGVPMKIFLPSSSAEHFHGRGAWVEQQFGPLPTATQLVPVYAEGGDRQALMQRRDRAVGEASEVILPVSIREGGLLEGLLHSLPARGKIVVDDFRVPYRGREQPLRYSVGNASVAEEVALLGDRYLFHWTRTADGPWPVERRIDFYCAAADATRYPRTAFDCLRSILRGGRIAATGTHMSGGTSTVCFSALPPAAMAPLMRWRARYTMMSFEPYGIGVERAWAAARGVKPVVYCARKASPHRGADGWLYQSIGMRTDWRQEGEWRCLGDFNVSQVPRDKLMCICRTGREVEKLKAEFELPCVAYEQG